MPKADLIAGLLLFAFGLALVFWIIPAETVEDTEASISPALLPQVCAIGITVLAAILILQAARGATEQQQAPLPSEWAAMLAVVVVVLAGVALFDYVHPVAAAAFVVAAPMLYMGERRWYLVAGLPTGLILGAYLLFYEVLGTAIG